MTASDAAADDAFGSSVALSGTTLIVGAAGVSSDKGAAYIFTLSDGTWTQSAELTASDGEADDTFGGSVALTASTAFVGAPFHEVGGHTWQGAVYVYTLSGGTWSQSAELTASDGTTNTWFGASIAVSGSALLVGADIATVEGDETEGAAYVFSLSDGTWSQSAELAAPSGATYFGSSVAIAGTTAVIGATGQSSSEGGAYVFSDSDDAWSQSAELTPSDGESGDEFGRSVAISGSTAIVGALYHEVSGHEDQGAAYVYSVAIPIGALLAVGVASNDATKHSTTCTSGSDPVNCASGDFWHTFTDASVAGYGPGLDLTRTYNSLEASTKGIFGYGWTSSYESSLTFNGDGSITINEADGSQVTAMSNGDGSFSIPAWADSTLTANEDGSYTFVYQGTTSFSYDSSGRLIAITDSSGYSTTLTYTSGKLTTVTDSSGRTITLAYGENGLVSSVTDPMDRETTYAYDDAGNLTSVTVPDSNVTSFTYDDNHLLLTMKFPNDQSGGPDAGDDVVNTYNDAGQVLSQTDPMGNEATYSYSGDNFSADGGSTTITDPDGNVEVQDYTNGVLQSLTKGYGTDSAATWSYSYDPDTLGLTQTTDPNSNVTSATYDADGNLLSSTNGLGNTTTYSYNSFNELTCEALPLASSPCSELSPPSAITAGTSTITPPGSAPPPYVTYYEYDTDGNLIYTATGDYPAGSDTLTQTRTTYNLYNGQSVTLGTTTDSCTTSAPATNLPCATIDADGVVTQLAYDSYGDLTSRSTPDENQGQNPGVINTIAGAPMGTLTATQTYQIDSQIATAAIGGTSYAYVADEGDDVIRRIDLANDDETMVAGIYNTGDAGTGVVATTALMDDTEGVVVDSSGDVAIADSANNVVRFVPAASGTYFGQSMTAGYIYIIAGNGTSGDSGNGGVATSAKLDNPVSVAFDGTAVVIDDEGNSEIRVVPDTSGSYFGSSDTAGDIYAVAGDATAGYSGDGGAATSAEVHSPAGISVDSSGDLYIADTTNNVIRFVPASSGSYFGESMTADDIYTVAGNGTAGYSGDSGSATSAELDAPEGVAIDGSSGVAIADSDNKVVRFIAMSTGSYFGESMTADDIYTIGGDGLSGSSGNGGSATSAHIDDVSGVAFDSSGDLLLSIPSDGLVRVVAATSGSLADQSVTADDIYAVAGSGLSVSSFTGPASESQLGAPMGVALDAAGDVYIVEYGSFDVRFIPRSSGTYFGQSMTANDIYTIVGGGSDSGCTGELATDAELSWPEKMAVDASGDIAIPTGSDICFVPKSSGTYFGQSMTANHIYKIAGGAWNAYSGDGGPANSSFLSLPLSVRFDAAGDVLITDSYNNAVRFVPVASGTYFGQSMTADYIYTIAGDGTAGYSGDGGAATSAELDIPESATFDAYGDVVIADSNNNVIRFVPIASGTYFGQSMTADHIYTIAGTGTSGYSGNGVVASSAELDDPRDVVVDSSGNVLIDDSNNDVIRFIPVTTGEFYGIAMTGGDIYTIAGSGWQADSSAGDGGPPLGATFSWTTSIASDGNDGFYIVDEFGTRIRYVSDAAPTATSTTTYTYNEDGQETSVTAPNGNLAGANAANFTTAFTYNDDGEVTAATQGGGEGATVTARTTDYGYDGDGNETSMTDPRGYVTDYAYNADDEQTLVTNPDSDATLTCYDGDGNVAETVPAVGVAADSLTAASCPTSYPTDYGDRLATDATTYAYNALNEETTVTTPAPPGLSGHEATTYAYDLGGRLTSVTAPPTSTSEDAANDVTTYAYDDANELLTTTTGYDTDTASTTSSCYDPDGKVTATVPGDGNTDGVATCSDTSPYTASSDYQTTYVYDSLGELVTQTAPETSAAPDGQVTTFTYDPDGNETSVENPDGVTATKTYTPTDLLASVSYSDSTTGATYDYDAEGNLTQMTDASGTTSNVYDPFDEETSTTNGANQTTSYAYDLDGDVTGITYPLTSHGWADTETVSYTYDHADEMATIEDFKDGTSDVTPSADGLTSELTLGSSGASISTAYAANDEPSSITLTKSSTLQEFAYSDAPDGGIVAETDTPSSSLSPADYTYDNQGRVTSDTPGTGSENSYSEDASDNLTTLPTGASGTYDDASELTSSVLSGTTTNYTYDASGNRTAESTGATVSATYNGVGELTSYDNASADLSSATYNALGLRTSETSTPSGGSASTQNFVWDTDTSVPVLLEDSTYAYIYGPSGTPFEQVKMSSGTVKYLVSDALGSVRGVVSSTGSLSSSTSYTARGAPETTGGLTSSTPFGFAGAYTDSTKLLYLENRYYDPSTGMFFTVDPDVGETGESYSYGNDDPIDQSDPLGLGTWTWLTNGADSLGHGIASGFDAFRHQNAAAGDWLVNQVNASTCNILPGPNRGSLAGWMQSQAGCGEGNQANSSAQTSVICTFVIGGVISGPYNWSNLETLLDHFGRHGPDFKSQTPQEYAQEASSFLDQMVGSGEIKIDPEDGAIRVYDPDTNTFAAYNPDGTSRTIFKPDEGQSYWDKQLGEEPWFGGE
ncbi:MAG: DUF6531 domain-containing protein [Acidimicrobiales bacterium]